MSVALQHEVQVRPTLYNPVAGGHGYGVSC
jgi:hypothetical protein